MGLFFLLALLLVFFFCFDGDCLILYFLASLPMHLFNRVALLVTLLVNYSINSSVCRSIFSAAFLVNKTVSLGRGVRFVKVRVC